MGPCFDEKTARELVKARRSGVLRSALEDHFQSCAACKKLVEDIARAEPAAARRPSRVFESWPRVDETIDLTPGFLAGPYRVESKLSTSAAGTIYRATDVRSNEVVALKFVIDPALRSRFIRESETLARLDHPAIVRYIAHGDAAGGMYLVMELLEGEDLAQTLSRGALPWQSVRALGLRLARALSHAHALGCVHRDLSSRNIFLPHGKFEEAKLLDFGLVRVDDSHKTNTTPQAMLGTAFYMAPEQVRNARNVDGRADLFGLGVLLHEALSGERPFQGPDVFTIWVRIVEAAAPDLRKLAPSAPEALVKLIDELLAKDREQRPPSADAVAKRLDALVE